MNRNLSENVKSLYRDAVRGARRTATFITALIHERVCQNLEHGATTQCAREMIFAKYKRKRQARRLAVKDVRPKEEEGGHQSPAKEEEAGDRFI